MAAEGFDGVYGPVFARTVEEAATVVEAFGFEGLSLTAPLKSGWGDRADVVYDDEASRRLGAVNTLKRTDGKWLARNLDVAGFLDPLDERRIAIAGRSALVLGAGGAARAAAWVLGQRGAAVTIAARREDAARHLASALGATVTTWPPTGRWDLIVNATPAGTWPAQDVMPVEWGALQTPVAYDLVYNPELTRWLDGAAQAGAQVIGGLDMLVGQAVRQREWWTRQAADAQVMRAAARAFVQETTGS
jgi:shikimate dehydrogenase